jgi:hypothetical protein
MRVTGGAGSGEDFCGGEYCEGGDGGVSAGEEQSRRTLTFLLSAFKATQGLSTRRHVARDDSFLEFPFTHWNLVIPRHPSQMVSSEDLDRNSVIPSGVEDPCVFAAVLVKNGDIQ